MGGAPELGGRGLVELPTGAAEVDVPNGSPPKKSLPPPPVEVEPEDCGEMGGCGQIKAHAEYIL